MAVVVAKFVHKISSNERDVEGPFEMAWDAALASKSALEREMRRLKLLGKGERLRGHRVEGDRIVTFPGRRSIWHSISLVPVEGRR